MSGASAVVLRRDGGAPEPMSSADQVARAVGLGPRPVPAVDGMILVTGGGLPEADPGLGPAWGAAVSALHRAQPRRWTVAHSGSSGADVLLDVVDAGGAGLWVVGSAGDVEGWRPVSSTKVWDLLAALLDAAAWPFQAAGPPSNDPS